MLKFNFKVNEKTSGAVLTIALLFAVLAFVAAPLALLVGINLILEGAGIATVIPYTFWTWVGALLVIATLKDVK